MPRILTTNILETQCIGDSLDIINDNFDNLDTAVQTVSAFTLTNTSFRNKLINAQGLVNQRVYVSGTATTAANQYTLDRWRVVTLGQNLTFSTSQNVVTFTAPAGGIEQVIEGNNVETGTYVLNWNGTATATVNGTARTKGQTFSLTGGSNVTVRFSNGTFSLPQLEKATKPSAFEYRHFGTELLLCQRYYEKSYNLNTAPGTANPGASIQFLSQIFPVNQLLFYHNVRFKVQKRTNPVIDIYTPSANGTKNRFWAVQGVPITSQYDLTPTAVAQDEHGLVLNGGYHTTLNDPQNGYVGLFHYVADAEL